MLRSTFPLWYGWLTSFWHARTLRRAFFFRLASHLMAIISGRRGKLRACQATFPSAPWLRQPSRRNSAENRLGRPDQIAVVAAHANQPIATVAVGGTTENVDGVATITCVRFDRQNDWPAWANVKPFEFSFSLLCLQRFDSLLSLALCSAEYAAAFGGFRNKGSIWVFTCYHILFAVNRLKSSTSASDTDSAVEIARETVAFVRFITSRIFSLNLRPAFMWLRDWRKN